MSLMLHVLTFSLRICASSSGEKSFWMLKSFRISSGVLPLIMLALCIKKENGRRCQFLASPTESSSFVGRSTYTVLQPTSRSGLMSR